jgi:hypothetical protein
MELQTDKRDNQNRILILLVLLAAAAVRFFNLGNMSLSNDELSSLMRIRYDSFSEMIRQGVYIDFHPAGLQTFLFYWVKLFGDDVFILRLPFACCGVFSVWLVYLIGRKWYNELTALLAASAFAFLSFTILFTQLARMYSPAIMFCLLCIYCWTVFVFDPDKRNRGMYWLGWVASMIFAMHLHYFSFMFVGLAGLSGLFFIAKRDASKYLFGGILGVVCFITELPVFFEQMKTGDIGGWLGPPSKTFLLDFAFELFNRSFLLCSIVLLFVTWGIFSFQKVQGERKWRVLSFFWFFISFSVAYLYSVLGHPVLQYSTLLFATPFMLLLIFSFVPKALLKANRILPVVAFFSFLFVYDTVISGKHYTTMHFGDFKKIAEDAERWLENFGKENVPVVANVINPGYINFYFDKMNNPPLVAAYKVENPANFSELYDKVSTSSSACFAYIWSNSLHPLEVPEIIRSCYPHLLEKKSYFNAEAYLFGKTADTSELKTKMFVDFLDFEDSLMRTNVGGASTDFHFSGKYSGRVEGEFSTSLRKNILPNTEGTYRYVTFSAWIYPVEVFDKTKIVLSFDRSGKPFGYKAFLLSDFKPERNKWQFVIIAAELPKEIMEDDVYSAYFWNEDLKTFYIDDLKVEIHSGDDPYERTKR